MRITNVCYRVITGISNILKRCLGISLELYQPCFAFRLTSKILTARSLLCKSQKAQLPSHRFPSLNAMGSTVLLRISSRTGPSLLFSTTRAMAIASWKSDSCLMQTLTASFKLLPRRKKAAAYSKDSLQFVGGKIFSINKPKRCLLRSAYAFLRAAVRHRGSVKSFERNFNITACSLCHAACLQSP